MAGASRKSVEDLMEDLIEDLEKTNPAPRKRVEDPEDDIPMAEAPRERADDPEETNPMPGAPRKHVEDPEETNPMPGAPRKRVEDPEEANPMAWAPRKRVEGVSRKSVEDPEKTNPMPGAPRKRVEDPEEANPMAWAPRKRVEGVSRKSVEDLEKTNAMAGAPGKSVEDLKTNAMARVSRRSVEDLEKTNAMARVSRRSVEDLEKTNAMARVSRRSVEDLEKTNVMARVSRRSVEDLAMAGASRKRVEDLEKTDMEKANDMAKHNTTNTLEEDMDLLESKITCSICHKLLKDPRVLPCCHYYCKLCIQNLYIKTGTSNPFFCPMCHISISFTDSSLEALPKASFVKYMSAMLSKMKLAYGKMVAKCELCSEHRSEAFCRQCAMFICKVCIGQHKKLKVLVYHEMLSFVQLKEGAIYDFLPKPAAPICQFHNVPVKFYCFDCKSLICCDCTGTGHENHNFQSSKTVAIQSRERLMKQLLPLREAQKVVDRAIDDILSIESEVEVQAHATTLFINRAFDELDAIIRTRRKELLREASMKSSAKLECLLLQKRGLSQSSAVAQSVIDYTEQFVYYTPEGDMCMINRHVDVLNRIEREIQDQKNREKFLDPVTEADMGVEVCFAKELKNLCYTKSFITTNTLIRACGQGLRTAEVSKLAKFQVSAKLFNGKPTKQAHIVDCTLKNLVSGSIFAWSDDMKNGKCSMQYIPVVRGRHELSVTVSGHPVKDSPFLVLAFAPPTELGRPVYIISNLNYPRDMAVNTVGEFVVANDRNLCLLNKKGEVVRSCEIDNFIRVAVDKTDNHMYAIIKSTTAEEITILVRLSPELKPLKKCQISSTTYEFTEIEVVGNEVMVCGQTNSCFDVYTKDLIFVRRIGKGGIDIRGFSSDEEGNLYVADYASKCIIVMSNAGDFLRSFDVPSPHGVCVAGEHVYVTSGMDKVLILSRTGRHAAAFGRAGSGEGNFNHPHAVCLDPDGCICVCDRYNSRIQTF